MKRLVNPSNNESEVELAVGGYMMNSPSSDSGSRRCIICQPYLQSVYFISDLVPCGKFLFNVSQTYSFALVWFGDLVKRFCIVQTQKGGQLQRESGDMSVTWL